MKLCPQCEFIYENDQRFCDMDGEALVYDSRAGVFPDPVPAVSGARPIKLRPRIVVMAVVAGLALSGLLSFAYHASSAGSKFVSRSLKPEAQETIPPLQIAPLLQNVLSSPSTNQPQSPANPEAASDSAGVGADELTPASQSARRQDIPKGTDTSLKAHNSRLGITKRLPPLPQLAPLPQLPLPERLPAVKLEAKTPGSTTAQAQGAPSQKLAVTNQKALVVEVKPARDNVNKQSRLGSFLKKTGRILKKPFTF
jgi:hypothetical protein